MRGKARQSTFIKYTSRITPACAGKSHRQASNLYVIQDHPRVCGEKSPHITSMKSSFRITPACAGKRLVNRCKCGRYRDHPRVCGEKIASIVFPIHCLGSPPRVRGKAYYECPYCQGHRITPACAGKSHLFLDVVSAFEDHPRVCGEKMLGRGVVQLPMGSPPRVRGKASFYHVHTSYDRITPACAGKSCRQILKQKHIQDHPRVCGEKRVEFFQWAKL